MGQLKQNTDKDLVIIEDWAGNILFEGDCNSEELSQVLKVNWCKYCEGTGELGNDVQGFTSCDICDGTGYEGDFEIFWQHPELNKDRNVYEYIRYFNY